ncbi:MAG: hypothetical protein ABIK73_07720 [candidate division WOR-3 bacterium]
MFATSLLIRHPEVLEFDEPKAIRLFYEDRLSEININKLIAASVLVKTNFFWAQFPHFCYLCRAIDEGIVTNIGHSFPDLDTIGWAIVEAVILTPNIDECRFIDKDIEAYILFLADKYYYLPFTIIPFLTETKGIEKYVENEKTVHANNYIVLRMRNYISSIKLALEETGQSLSVVAADDLEKRILLFRSSYNGEEELINLSK